MSYLSCLLCKLTMMLRKESTKGPEAPGTNLPLHSDDHLIFLATVFLTISCWPRRPAEMVLIYLATTTNVMLLRLLLLVRQRRNSGLCA